MLKKDFEEIVVSADEYRDEHGYYVFPFEVLDKTPGGRNLGRIEWHIEPVKGKKKDGRHSIEKLYVWATQTYDPRYKGKVFEIPCFSECLYARVLPQEKGKVSYLHRIWKAALCEIHGGMYFSAYPDDHHEVLKINVGSSISIDAEFE